jgi:flagellar biosynthetic protein FlhB
MADQDLDRSEAATPFKLQKARAQGQTARSVDVVGSAVFLAGVAWLTWQGGAAWQALLEAARLPLLYAGEGRQGLSAWWPLVTQLVTASARLLAPLFAALMGAAIVASMAQTGAVLSFEPLRMDFSRLNPVTGLQRICSLRTLFNGARACVKLVLLALVAWFALRSLFPQFHALGNLSAGGFVQLLLQDLGSLGWKMGLALALVGCADLAFTRREFGQRMRMSRRELKEEYRHREGDPRIRGRLRELRREMLKRSQSVQNTREADVVLTNPTHYAVALRYVHGEMDAPRVIAKGAGQLAAAMREMAARHRVVVVQNPPLARRLYREAPLDATIPASFHAEVARIIVWVLAARRRREAAAAAALAGAAA